MALARPAAVTCPPVARHGGELVLSRPLSML